MLRASRQWLVLTPRQALRILALSPTTDLTPASIKKAYIQQTLRCHPDLHPGDPDANDNFRNLSDAFRIALKTLELQHTSAARPLDGDGVKGADLYDPQAVLEALRQAMLSYRAHEAGGAADASSADVFFTPSLEDISSVCQREAVAMRRVHTFCAELPAVLCGSQSAALFEAVAFFHARYVESMSACVMRFAQNLPLLVRRVVKQRRRYVDVRYSATTKGIGTGNRPRTQRIEDMAMRPLVLMGALIFDVPDAPSEDVLDRGGSKTAGSSSSSSTCGVSRPADVRVCSALKCVIYPADSVADITAKVGSWEAASFERLKVELAIVDVNRLLSGMLGLQEEEADTQSQAHLAVMPHLAVSLASTEAVLRTLQRLATDLCFHFDPAMDGSVTDDVVSAMRLDDRWETSASLQDDAAAATLSLPVLVAQCRRLAALARPTVRGNTFLTWDADDVKDLVVDPSELESPTASPDAKGGSSQQRRHSDAAPTFIVGRHLSCSTAETLLFSVSLALTKDLRTFLMRLRQALKRVVQATNESKQVLFSLLPLREETVKEEFIALPKLQVPADAAEEEHADSPYRYRGPIHCFPRVCNMDACREHQLWKLLHSNREYIAAHAPTMNPLNIFYESYPYDPESPEYRPPPSDAASGILAGWVSNGADGCDNVIITAQELDDAVLFREWVEEVVAQSALSREAEELLTKAGVGYVSRDPSLPLANFLSFAKVFVQSLAVRGVLERRAGDAASHHTVATPDDTGLSIIVSASRCDVRDGGRFFIPWYVDPSILLALLGEAAPQHQIHS